MFCINFQLSCFASILTGQLHHQAYPLLFPYTAVLGKETQRQHPSIRACLQAKQVLVVGLLWSGRLLVTNHYLNPCTSVAQDTPWLWLHHLDYLRLQLHEQNHVPSCYHRWRELCIVSGATLNRGDKIFHERCTPPPSGLWCICWYPNH